MSFAGLHALSGVDLALKQGTIVGLIGPNGSGKTTLLNILSGVLAPTFWATRRSPAGRPITLPPGGSPAPSRTSGSLAR